MPFFGGQRRSTTHLSVRLVERAQRGDVLLEDDARGLDVAEARAEGVGRLQRRRAAALHVLQQIGDAELVDGVGHVANGAALDLRLARKSIQRPRGVRADSRDRQTDERQSPSEREKPEIERSRDRG